MYWTAYNTRYSSGAEGKIIEDLGRMDDIISEKSISYRADEIRIEPEDIKDWRFSTSDAVPVRNSV